MTRITVLATLLLVIASMAFAGGGGGEQPAASPAPASVQAQPTLSGYSDTTVAGVHIQWLVDGDTLRVQMSAQTTGWIAVGFDPSRMMKDANVIIGYVADGKVNLEDDYGLGNTRHGPDVANGGEDNLANVEGDETNGVTTIRFSIPLDSGDPMDRPLKAGSSYPIIAAHGPNGADDFGTYHAERGHGEMQL